MHHELNPPAIVLLAQPSQAELKAKAKSIRGRMGTRDRQNLEDALELGGILVSLKAQTEHGKWLPLLEELSIVPSWGQRLMKLAKCDLSRISECSTITEALEKIGGGEENAEAEIVSSPLPAALAYYSTCQHEGVHLVSDEALQLLTGLVDSYRPEVLTPFPLGKINLEDCKGKDGIFGLLNVIRPLDSPPAWPLVPRDMMVETVAKGLAVFVEDARSRLNNVPQWEVAAFWFASTFVGVWPLIKDDVEDLLERCLRNWRELFVTALAMTCLGKEACGKLDDHETIKIWLGFCSDMRLADKWDVTPEWKDKLRVLSS
jgi:hypothetical protein